MLMIMIMLAITHTSLRTTNTQCSLSLGDHRYFEQVESNFVEIERKMTLQ